MVEIAGEGGSGGEVASLGEGGSLSFFSPLVMEAVEGSQDVRKKEERGRRNSPRIREESSCCRGWERRKAGNDKQSGSIPRARGGQPTQPFRPQQTQGLKVAVVDIYLAKERGTRYMNR